MSSQFSRDEEVLARLVREAGDPSVSPDPQYAETLRATILGRLAPAETAKSSPLPLGEGQGVRAADSISPIILERTRQMKRIAKFAVAATILVAVGILVFWMTIGDGSTNIAFARVADALDSLRSATFDATGDMKDPVGGKSIHMKTKGMFLAPSRQRMESSIGDKSDTSSVMIMDMQAGKAIMLMPEKKFAIAIHGEQMKKEMEKSTGHPSPDLFEMVRRLVREGSSGLGEKAELLGTREIDGRKAVGFRTRPSNAQEFTLWADPQTALPIRVEITTAAMMEGQMVMNNFRYDVDLDPSLFNLEPPPGYTTQTMNVATPVEEDLLKILRLVAEHNKGDFPAAIGMNKEIMQAVQAFMKPEMDKLETKYGVKLKPGEAPPPAMMAEAMKNLMPLMQKQMQGVMFYMSLKPENDSHYAGKDVKLGTPDRPIFWYKPTGAKKYRVIYADMSVKEMTADEVEKLPEAKSK